MAFCSVDLVFPWVAGSGKATGFSPCLTRSQQLETPTTRKLLPHSGWEQLIEKVTAMISIHFATASEKDEKKGNRIMLTL